MTETVEQVNMRRRVANGAVWVGVAIIAAYFTLLPAALRAVWPTLLRVIGEDGLATWASMLSAFTWFAVGNLVFLVLYWRRFPFIEQFKISKKPWPWMSPDAAERERFAATLRSAVWLVLFNNFCVALPAVYISHWANRGKDMMSTSLEAWPSMFTIVWQIMVCVAIDDTTFYFVHRMLHMKALYPYVHKWHHHFHHVVAISAESSHPIEFLVSSVSGVFAGAVLLKVHLAVFWMFVWLRLSEGLDAHSGYAFPWSPFRLLPFLVPTEAHDYHHSHNVGCFGSQFVFWDRVMGTDASFKAHWAKRYADDAAASGKKTAAAEGGSVSNGVGANSGQLLSSSTGKEKTV